MAISDAASFTGQLFLCYVAASIAHFVSFEMGAIDALSLFGLLTHLRRRALIAVVRMETVIYVAVEFCSAMKPGAGADYMTVCIPAFSRASGHRDA